MYIILGIILLFLSFMIIPRLLMAFKISKMKGKEAATPHNASRKRIKGGAKTILYFYTPSCSACKIQNPIIEKIMKKHSNAIFKIDASQQRAVASAYGVLGVPFIAFIENRKIVNASAGVQSEAVFESFFSN